MLNEKKQGPQKITNGMIPFRWMSRSTETGSWLLGLLGADERWREWQQKDTGFTCGVKKNVPVEQLCEYTKNNWIKYLKKFNFMACKLHTSI